MKPGSILWQWVSWLSVLALSSFSFPLMHWYIAVSLAKVGLPKPWTHPRCGGNSDEIQNQQDLSTCSSIKWRSKEILRTTWIYRGRRTQGLLQENCPSRCLGTRKSLSINRQAGEFRLALFNVDNLWSSSKKLFLLIQPQLGHKIHS